MKSFLLEGLITLTFAQYFAGDCGEGGRGRRGASSNIYYGTVHAMHVALLVAHTDRIEARSLLDLESEIESTGW